MGGGNGCKSAAKREKNLAKLQKAGKKTSQKDALKNQPMRICKRCFTTFPYTAREPELRSHCENKHAEFKFEQSFPDYGKEEKKEE